MNWETKLKITGPSGSSLNFNGELTTVQKNIILSVLHGMPDMANSKAYSAMLYALADEMRQEEGCVTESPDLVEEAAERIDYQTVMIRGFEIQRDALLALLQNDAYAISFQTLGQYRSAIIAAVKGGAA